MEVPSSLLTLESPDSTGPNEETTHDTLRPVILSEVKKSNALSTTSTYETQLGLPSAGKHRLFKGLQISLENKGLLTVESDMSSHGLELKVSRCNGRESQAIRVTALPDGLTSSNSTVEVKFPDGEGETAKIIIHEKDHSERSGIPFPIIVERDPRFLSTPRRLLTHTKPDDSDSDGESDGSELDDMDTT